VVPVAVDNAAVEPIASSGAGAVFRASTAAASPELSTLLRDGRVLAAEVLAGGTDGTLLLALGKHAVPAETDLRFPVGTRFLVRVEEEAQGVVLRVLGESDAEESPLLRALRAVLADEHPIGERYRALAAALRSERSPLPPATETLAQGLPGRAVRPDGGGAALRATLLSVGLAHEATLAAVLAGRLSREALERLRSEWKAALLRAWAELPDGALRESVARVLSAIEAEQLLNVARERAGEPLVHSFPFPDGDGFTTARLQVPARDRRDSEEEAGAPDGSCRIALGVELSALGPVRADLALTPDWLVVRLVVTRAEALALAERGLAALRARLGDGRRGLKLHVRQGTRAEATVGDPMEIAFLRDHRLLSVSG